MNKLDSLIAELCQNGVEYKTIEEIVDLTMGTSPDGDTVSSDASGVEFHQGKTCFSNMFLNLSGQYTSSPVKFVNS